MFLSGARIEHGDCAPVLRPAGNVVADRDGTLLPIGDFAAHIAAVPPFNLFRFPDLIDVVPELGGGNATPRVHCACRRCGVCDCCIDRGARAAVPAQSLRAREAEAMCDHVWIFEARTLSTQPVRRVARVPSDTADIP
jgi:hypothetical protein